MKLTINQTLHQGVIAHKAGNIKEAEQLYKMILQFQPQHPDANHNLGLIVLSRGLSVKALKFFEAAIHSYPETEQFWLSYIEALIRDRQFEKAKIELQSALKKNFSKNKLDALEYLLTSIENRKFDSSLSTQINLEKLSNYLQEGRFDDAENLAVSITRQFPNSQYGWKVLGVLLRQKGEKLEAV
ncbi:MAG: tetratricopeptide repeat protein, partial [Gammaproteobacteria bacterium]|nr:tetratricopeptide repeat protein [Gammaproteobacteria bacterium]